MKGDEGEREGGRRERKRERERAMLKNFPNYRRNEQQKEKGQITDTAVACQCLFS